MQKTHLTIIISLVFLNIGCNDNPVNYHNELKNHNMLTSTDFSALAGKRVYFGHQSVGKNIIGGLNSLINKDKELKFLKIITLDEYLRMNVTTSDSTFYFIHSGIGKNGFPESKLEDFEQKIDTLRLINAAFMKLCFVDFNKNTNVDKLYRTYIETLTNLEERNSNIKFVYFTVPLIIKRNFFDRLLRSVLGRPDVSYKRNQFNRLIRETPNINLFDIAFLESHLDNNSEEIKEEYLLKYYASDAGHLNDIGSEKVAIQLLKHINNIFNGN